MIDSNNTTNPTVSTSRHRNNLSIWAALSMSVLTMATFAVAITTPPRSGPFCRSTCISYPYTEATAFFPRDYLWMVPALLLPILFVVCMAAMYQYTTPERKLISQIGLMCAMMAAVILTSDYFIQLTVIQPSLLNQETDGIALISQYNPHGIFIALESLGYLLMGGAFGCAAGAVVGRTRVEQALRWLFAGGFVLVVGGGILFSLIYGNRIEYRLEVFVIVIDWLVMIIAGVLLSIVFRHSHSR